jgi:hypothetical protein
MDRLRFGVRCEHIHPSDRTPVAFGLVGPYARDRRLAPKEDSNEA